MKDCFYTAVNICKEHSDFSNTNYAKLGLSYFVTALFLVSFAWKKSNAKSTSRMKNQSFELKEYIRYDRLEEPTIGLFICLIVKQGPRLLIRKFI